MRALVLAALLLGGCSLYTDGTDPAPAPDLCADALAVADAGCARMCKYLEDPRDPSGRECVDVCLAEVVESLSFEALVCAEPVSE